MINEIFKTKSPFVYEYFSNLLNLVDEGKKNFPQAMIFEGMDTISQFLFSLELARILNCKEDKNTNCTCTNCKWIKNLEHPSVNIVSQIHFKPEDDTSKTVISVKQASLIEKTLMLSSDYYRFFIFFSSEDGLLSEKEISEFENYGIEKEIDFKIEPLNYKTFNPNAINALLKSVEEPPKNTCFIFLTKSKEDIIPTIVSRCQVFKISKGIEKLEYNNILSLIEDYFNINYNNAFDVSENFLNYIKQESVEAEEILNKLIEYLKELIKSNISNNNIYLKLNNDIKLINLAIKQIKASMSEKIVLDSLFLAIAKGNNNG